MQYLVTTFDNGTIDWSSHQELLKNEARYIYAYYKQGFIRNLWFSENKDALLIIESNSIEKANSIIKELPLIKTNLLKYSITCLLPYTGYERLINGVN